MSLALATGQLLLKCSGYCCTFVAKTSSTSISWFGYLQVVAILGVLTEKPSYDYSSCVAFSLSISLSLSLSITNRDVDIVDLGDLGAAAV